METQLPLFNLRNLLQFQFRLSACRQAGPTKVNYNMESPPPPKRALISFKDFKRLPMNDMGNSPNTPSDVLRQSVQILRNCKPNESEVPNLSIFVNKLAEEQKQQLEFLKARKDILCERNDTLATLRVLQTNLLQGVNSWKRKTYLAVDESATLRSNIIEARDRIVELLKTKYKLTQLPVQDISPINKEFYRHKMQKFIKDLEICEANCPVSKRIVEIDSQIAKKQLSTSEVLNNVNALKNNEKYSQNDISQLEEEKAKLSSIFERKINNLESEKLNFKNANVEADTVHKRLVAQKVRLRSRVSGNKQRIQHIEEEGLVLQVEIDELIAKRNNRIID